MPAGLVAIQSHHVSDRDFERTDFYNEFVRPVGGFHGMSVCHRLPALSSFLAVCRRRRDDDFDASDQAALQSLSPHLSVALRLRQHLGVADLRTAGALAALERLNTGVMIVDAAAHLVFANEIALGLFRDGRGLGLDRDGLCTGDPAATRALRRLIAASADVSTSNGGTVALPRGEAHASLRIVVAPFRPFALEIARGDGRKAAATRLDIAVTTARTHLTHIFEKTGVRRQAELVRLLMDLEDGLTVRIG
jgi:hypothetical protein